MTFKRSKYLYVHILQCLSFIGKGVVYHFNSLVIDWLLMVMFSLLLP